MTDFNKKEYYETELQQSHFWNDTSKELAFKKIIKLFDKVSQLEADLETTKAANATLKRVVEAMAIKLDESNIECPWKENIRDYDCGLRNYKIKNCIECFKNNFRAEAEKGTKR
jgi:hypothetical protein